MDIEERLTAFAMLGAGWVMWLLVGLSVIVLAIALERAYYLLTSRDDIAKLTEDLFKFLNDGNLEGAQKRLSQSKAFEAKILCAGIEGATQQGAASAEERMAGASAVAKLHMERNLAFLGTVGNNAPFIGLLGTVIGVIRAFQALDGSGGQVSSGLMAEIGHALVATAIGILVALPAVATFNLFHRVIKARLSRANQLGHTLMAYLKADSRSAGYRAAAD